MMDLKTLQQRFPDIHWDEPIKITAVEDPKRVHYACRVCIANQGLLGSAIPSLPRDPEAVRRHIEADHG